jgi:hypothetical protein
MLERAKNQSDEPSMQYGAGWLYSLRQQAAAAVVQ